MLKGVRSLCFIEFGFRPKTNSVSLAKPTIFNLVPELPTSIACLDVYQFIGIPVLGTVYLIRFGKP